LRRAPGVLGYGLPKRKCCSRLEFPWQHGDSEPSSPVILTSVEIFRNSSIYRHVRYGRFNEGPTSESIYMLLEKQRQTGRMKMRRRRERLGYIG